MLASQADRMSEHDEIGLARLGKQADRISDLQSLLVLMSQAYLIDDGNAVSKLARQTHRLGDGLKDRIAIVTLVHQAEFIRDERALRLLADRGYWLDNAGSMELLNSQALLCKRSAESKSLPNINASRARPGALNVSGQRYVSAFSSRNGYTRQALQLLG